MYVLSVHVCLALCIIVHLGKIVRELRELQNRDIYLVDYDDSGVEQLREEVEDLKEADKQTFSLMAKNMDCRYD